MNSTTHFADVAGELSGAPCPQCGGVVANGESCADRFALLLALDHARQEPWGTRHGVAFSVYTLQHSNGAEYAALNRCWAFLLRALNNEDPMQIAASIRALHARGATSWGAEAMRRVTEVPRRFEFTIADMGDFEADSYLPKLDAWCRATLKAWNNAR